ncbi:hypothetical protein EWM64_g5160 [Hericium alpestre]|uniref:F-box domain-containing protein n=1 Tax=Hericium alpestre TaxID=135208 RepID=A0A4Y9ZZB6_9AGAM|nr:hypothetical protein EWM64_g5160 [Hericium alpestre]
MSLKLYFGGDWPRECEGFLYAMFSSIRETCPLLETVETRHMMVSDVDWLNALVFSVFFNITHAGFTCQPSFDTLMCLSSMPKLQTLHADSVPWSPFVWGTASLLDFPSLRHLHWPALHYGEVTTFLHRIQLRGQTRKIETIKIINRDFDIAEFVGFLDVLRATCSMQILSSISLWSSSLDENMIDLSPALSLLFPLFDFSCIEVLEIDNLPIEFDDAFLAAASTAWPQLHVLRLTPLRLKASGITLAGLALLSVQSRCLEKLELDITNWSSNIPFPPVQGGNDIETTSLTLSVTINHPLNYYSMERMEWEMQGSAMQDEEKVAKIGIIRSIFPNAKVHYNWLYYR